MASTTSTVFAQPIQSTDDEIDLLQLWATLQRRWRLIALVSGGTLALTAAITLIQKPVWEGEFQIVLATKESPAGGAQALLQANPGLANLVGAKGGGNQLETEVKILESPSVLKPVFDAVKAQKARSGEDVSDWTYADWVDDSLEIKLEKGTSVLNLVYRDSDKSVIRPVLQQISAAYQAYSGRDRQRGLAQAITYLDQQIRIYRDKSLLSLRQSQQFAIEQDLTALKDDQKGDAEVVNAFNIEAIRVQAANEIRSLNEQLKRLTALGNDPEAIMYLGSTIPDFAARGLPRQLEQIDTQLANLQARFTDREDSIRLLKQRRVVLIAAMQRQAFGYLQANRTAAQARLAAAERPKGVLIRYRELLRQAKRDEATLNRLETERQVLALEQARKQEPWELISTPTLLDRPVSPRKGRNLALGLLAGLVLGSGAALVAERRSGLVFSLDELRQQMACPLLAQLTVADRDQLNAQLQLLATGVLSGSRRIGLIPVGLPVDDAHLHRVLEQLQTCLPNAYVVCSADLVQLQRCDQQLLITAPGEASRQQLAILRQQLELQQGPLAGWLLLEGRDV